MFMDPNSNEFPDFIYGFKADDETLVPNANQYSRVENGLNFTVPSPDLNFLNVPFKPLDPDPGIITPSSTLSPDLESLGASMSLSPDGNSFPPSSGWSPEGEASSPSDDSDSSDPVLKYISQMLMEEKMEEKPCMFYDPSALQATERSLYEVLGEQQPYYPSSLTQPSVYLNTESGENSNSFSSSSSDLNRNSGGVSGTTSGGSDFVDTLLVGDTGYYSVSLLQNPHPDEYRFQSNSQLHSSQFSFNPPESLTTIGHGLMSSVNEFLAQNKLSDREPAMRFKKGMEEASKRYLKTESGENSSSFSSSSSDFNNNSGGVGGTSSGVSTFVDTLGDTGDYGSSLLQNPPPDEYGFRSNSQQNSSQFSVNPPESTTTIGHGLMSSVNEFLAQNMLSNRESVVQFRKGMEEANKFLPTGNQLITNLESSVFSADRTEDTSKVVVKAEKEERENSPEGSRGRKNHRREDVDFEEERSNKQSALYVEESELSDMFDKVLLLNIDSSGKPIICTSKDYGEDRLQQNGQSNESGGKSRARKQGKKKDTVDLRTLLILCAQAVSSNDSRTANELLKQIRQHSSPTGDGSQRLAHFFANGLEARLAGSGTGTKNFLKSLAPKKSAAEVLKAYKVYLSACPFKKLAYMFAVKMIMKVSEKATTLHIVDFGILYGFHWPMLIQFLPLRPGGPPKLRITGIELPQPGFRPAERIEETGRRLEKYCQRFNVPFEYNCIPSQNWETIQIEDLKINPDEVLAVNCLFRFKNLLDETVEVNCPRDAVLNLIRKIKPDIFVNAIVNGSYNAPFFVTRFREAIFHFSSLFDMFDTTMPREDPERFMFEREFYGREAMNVIACEGVERVERPETYKQWQARSIRAGFKQIPLDQGLMDKLRGKLTPCYHKDFVIDQDNNWMLQGWKGRIVYASSCWVPA